MVATAGQISDLGSEAVSKAVHDAVRKAAASCETLFVASVAKTIAARHGASARDVDDRLTQAGIQAGATMQFGRPE